MDRRTEILSGTLSFPKQIKDILNPTEEQEITIEEMWNTLWHNFLIEKSIDTLIWYDQMNNQKFFNKLLLHLSKAGWINSVIDSNYAYIELLESKILKWITREELSNLRFQAKWVRYRLTASHSKYNNLVNLNRKVTKTGLVREGFRLAGNNAFRYDTKYIQKYLNEITFNLEKGLSGSTKDITYQDILECLISFYSVDTDIYTLGQNVCDSRGRAIFRCTKKLFNPISSKDARACLTCPEQYLTKEGLQAIYVFVAELMGYKEKNHKLKAAAGENAYLFRLLPDINKMREENNYDNLYELIWLERIYDALDKVNWNNPTWNIPIEVDATASMIQMMGVLLNNHQYLDETNLVGKELKDFWTLPYCSREHSKRAFTPMLYGSSKFPTELWEQNRLEYTKEMVNNVMLELIDGKMKEAASFKDFIINNVEPSKKMKVHIYKDEFYIECNRFKWEYTERKEYLIYSTNRKMIKTVIKEVRQVPDLKQFKRYFVTLLLHNLDSQVADHLCQQIEWILPNHDAFVVHPSDAQSVRKLYADKMYEIYQHRHKILDTYFHDIGIKESWQESNEEEVDKFLPTALK